MKYLWILLFFTPQLFAEYRVYEYSVRSTLNKAYDQDSYIVKSTLPPLAYQMYHGGEASLQVDLIRTWMCYGNTGNGEELCSSPEEQLLSEAINK